MKGLQATVLSAWRLWSPSWSEGSVVEGVVTYGDGRENGPSTWTHAEVFPVDPGESGCEICLERERMLGRDARIEGRKGEPG